MARIRFVPVGGGTLPGELKWVNRDHLASITAAGSDVLLRLADGTEYRQSFRTRQGAAEYLGFILKQAGK